MGFGFDDGIGGEPECVGGVRGPGGAFVLGAALGGEEVGAEDDASGATDAMGATVVEALGDAVVPGSPRVPALTPRRTNSTTAKTTHAATRNAALAIAIHRPVRARCRSVLPHAEAVFTRGARTAAAALNSPEDTELGCAPLERRPMACVTRKMRSADPRAAGEPNSASAAASSTIDAKRCAGSFSKQRRMTASNPGGTSVLSARIDAGVSCRIAAHSSGIVSPSNGGRPVKSSYIVVPSAQMSAR